MKRALVAVFSLGAFLLTAADVMAFSVRIGGDGVLTIFQSKVLGDDSKNKVEDRVFVPDGKGQEEKKSEMSGRGVELKLEPGNLKTLEIKKFSVEDRSKKRDIEKNKEDLNKQLESAKEIEEKQVDFLKNQLEKQNDLQKKLKSNTVKELTEKESEIEIGDGASISDKEKGFEIRDGGSRVKTDLGLSIDVETKKISVEGADGKKTEIEKSLDEVASELSKNEVIDSLSKDNAGSPSGSLVNRGGEVVYEINGDKKERLFGVLPVNVPKQVDVSPSTGQVIRVNQGIFSRFLDFFSF